MSRELLDTAERMAQLPPDIPRDATIVTRNLKREYDMGGEIVRALRGVSFDLRPGEVHALVGENGAGKSTLVKIITGAIAPDEGTLAIDGRTLDRIDPHAAHRAGIAAVYQQPALFPHLSIAENIALPLERGRPWRVLDWRGRAARARALLDRVGSPLDPRRTIDALTMPEQQIVEIARALGADARVVIMDEPTASLGDREVDSLFRALDLLRQQGAGVIYISHRLEEIFRVADRITVLRDGESVGTFARAEITRQELVRLMVGRPMSDVYPAREEPVGPLAGVSGLMVAEAAAESAGGRPVWWLPDARAAAGALGPRLTEGDMLITIGAGDIFRLAEELVGEEPG